eukprot:6947752-Prymnesium_polylepis.1
MVAVSTIHCSQHVYPQVTAYGVDIGEPTYYVLVSIRDLCSDLAMPIFFITAGAVAKVEATGASALRQ